MYMVDNRQLLLVFHSQTRHALLIVSGAPNKAWPVLSACMGEPHASAQLLLCTSYVSIVDVDLHLQGGQVQLCALHLQATTQQL